VLENVVAQRHLAVRSHDHMTVAAYANDGSRANAARAGCDWAGFTGALGTSSFGGVDVWGF